jgi:hypothetical protein
MAEQADYGNRQKGFAQRVLAAKRRYRGASTITT